MDDLQTREAPPFGRLWSSLSHLLPLSSAISIFLSIWQLKGFLGHFDLQLVGLVSLNDAALQFFVIVSWFLPLLILAAVYVALTPEQRAQATFAAFLASLGVTAVAAIAPGPLALGLGAPPLHLAGPTAGALVSLLSACGAILTLAFGLVWIGDWAGRRTGSARVFRLLRGAGQVIGAPLLVAALVLASAKIGEIRAVSQEIQFFDWPAAGARESVRYRTQLLSPPPELAACACGLGVIWAGEKVMAVQCGERTISLRPRDSIVLSQAPGTPRSERRLIDRRALSMAPTEAQGACRAAASTPKPAAGPGAQRIG